MSDGLREGMAEVNALLDDLERSRFKPSQRMERKRFTWTNSQIGLLRAIHGPGSRCCLESETAAAKSFSIRSRSAT
jgi:hypothetical protein